MDMKPIEGKAELSEQSGSVAPVKVSRGHLSAAQYLLPAARFLVEGPSAVTPGLAFLCGHILESLLKAFLVGSDTRPRKGHGLTGFWLDAVRRGLPLEPTPPPWAQALDRLHDNPYYLRYPRAHVFSTPAAEQMVSELARMLETVRASLGGTGQSDARN